MKLLIISDIHCETHFDGGLSFINNLNDSNVDICILAGDICASAEIPTVLNLFCKKFNKVVYVLGNHEYWGLYSREQVKAFSRQAVRENKNLHWLDNETVIINNHRIVGGTMWFPNAPLVPTIKSSMPDFRLIPNFEQWVYEENKNFTNLLLNDLHKNDIVITHHLPSAKSVDPYWKGSILNTFFVCDVESVIEDVQPSIWIHGHTHSSMNYNIGQCNIICNPFGYATMQNSKFNEHLIVDTGL